MKTPTSNSRARSRWRPLTGLLTMGTRNGGAAQRRGRAAVPAGNGSAAQHVGDGPRPPHVLRGLQRRVGLERRRCPRHRLQARRDRLLRLLRLGSLLHVRDQVFTPTSATADKICAGAAEWSGDWLNYMTMSRIDAMRKVLYGGLRSTDTATETVLQRAFIPQDAHSWGKEYTSIATTATTSRTTRRSTSPAGPARAATFSPTRRLRTQPVQVHANPAIDGVALPLFRVVENAQNARVWNWVSKERPVTDTSDRTFGGVAPARRTSCACRSARRARTIAASDELPVVRHRTQSPIGLLQDYGENDTMLFGLHHRLVR